MSTTVSYKGETLTTVTNQTRTLKTAGKYMEADVILTDTTQGGGTYQSKTVSPSTSQQTVRPDTGYDALSQVTVNAMPAMSLPQYPDSTSTGTRAGIVYPSSSATRYLNIPTGYNDSAKHYEITPMALGRKTITQNGTYTAEYDDLDGYYEVEVNVGGVTPSDPWVLGEFEFNSLNGNRIAVFLQDNEIRSVSGFPNVGAWFLITSSSRGNLANGEIVACIGDSTGIKTYAYTSNGVAEISTPDVYLSIPDTDAVSVCFDDQSGGYTFTNGGYKLYCLYKNAQDLIYRTLTFRTATYAPASGQISAQYSVSENPPIYFCGLSTTVALASYHRVQTVFKRDYSNLQNLTGTNFYTGMIGLITEGMNQLSESYSNGTLTLSTNSSNDGGYFHNPGTYTLHYFLAEDLAGSGGSGQTKSRTYTPTTSTQTEAITPDTGYDGLDQVNITVNPIPSEYVIPTGNLAITQNGTGINVSQYATVSVNVTGGGANIDTKTATASNYATSLAFTGMRGRPSAFFLRTTTQISSSGSTTYYYITDMRYNGTNTTGNCFRIGSTRRVDNITSGYSWSYSGTTLTITSSAASRSASPGSFYNGTYELVYIY